MKPVVFVDSCRTAIGRYGGILKDVRPDDMAALMIRTLVERNQINGSDIEDVYWGAANQAGEDNRNVDRMAVLLAGLPFSVPGVTVNRLCASSLEAINLAAKSIMSGEGDIYIAGGSESMSRAPFVMAKADQAFSRTAEIYDTTIGWRFTNPDLAEKYYPFSMGETAENVAKKYNLTRSQQDEFALNSQNKAVEAQQKGRFAKEIVPVQIKQKKETIIIEKDEHPRAGLSLEKLGALQAAFVENGTVTAGNSSGINDGASAVLMMSEEKAKQLGLKPIARYRASAAAGVDPSCMGIGPVPATQKALNRAGITISDLGLIELNEAFAAQSLACIQDLKLDIRKVNVNGGAIALGHPLGCSGARLMTTLLNEFKLRSDVKYGLTTMCVGVGQGVATIVENVWKD